MSEDSLLGHALVRLDEAATHLNIDPDVIEKLKFARETTKVRLMIRMDDGSRKSFLAWRCRYDDTRGPTKGGIRFHPDANGGDRSREGTLQEILKAYQQLKSVGMV